MAVQQCRQDNQIVGRSHLFRGGCVLVLYAHCPLPSSQFRSEDRNIQVCAILYICIQIFQKLICPSAIFLIQDSLFFSQQFLQLLSEPSVHLIEPPSQCSKNKPTILTHLRCYKVLGWDSVSPNDFLQYMHKYDRLVTPGKAVRIAATPCWR